MLSISIHLLRMEILTWACSFPYLWWA